MFLEVYADIVFLINFFMDFFIFWATGKFLSKNILKRRLFLGAIVASAMYCCVIFIDFFEFIYNPVGLLAILVFSVFLAFGAATLKELFKNVFVFIIISFAVGGLAEALFYFMNISDFIGNLINMYVHNFSLKFLIFSVSVFYIILKFISIWYKNVALKKQVFCNIQLFLNDKSVFLNALVDTGNSLCEPISGKPVIISEFEAVKKILPKNFCGFLLENDKKELEKIYDYIKNDYFNIELRIIPFSSLGKKSGILIGFLADKAVFYSERNICCEKVVIGICKFKLSAKGDYNALLNPKMLNC